MNYIKNASLYFYKVLFVFFFFPIGGMLIISMFGNNLISSFLFGFCLILISIMKFKDFLKDPDFDFNTFILVIIIIPIIIDYFFKITYTNFNFFQNMGLTYEVLIQYFYNVCLKLTNLDNELKNFYSVGLASFVMIKYFIAQCLNYFYLDYVLIVYFCWRLLLK